jgi:hypothetical protein
MPICNDVVGEFRLLGLLVSCTDMSGDRIMTPPPRPLAAAG